MVLIGGARKEMAKVPGSSAGGTGIYRNYFATVYDDLDPQYLWSTITTNNIVSKILELEKKTIFKLFDLVQQKRRSPYHDKILRLIRSNATAVCDLN